MKLPNGEHAVVDFRKLQDYCLNPHHPRGRNKARVFASIGIRQEDAKILTEAIREAVRNSEAIPGTPVLTARDTSWISSFSAMAEQPGFAPPGLCGMATMSRA